MSVFSTMYTGMSGMHANEHAIGVIGDNIANMNTIGFKGSRGTFSDMLNQSLYGPAGAFQLGQGTMVTGSQRLHKQGALLGTGVTTDMAVSGNGFFVVEGQANAVEGQFYTRNGQFTVDEEGFLVSPGGFKLQGFTADATGDVSTALGDLQVGLTTSEPTPTTSIELNLNLDANAEIATNAFDPLNPEDTTAFSTSVTVYDSLGNEHQLDVYFQKTDEGQWEWHALADGGEVNGGTPGESIEVADGTLAFTPDGLLDLQSQNNAAVEFVGATGQELAFDFGEALQDQGDGSGSTGYGGASTVDLLEQDGFGVGTFQFMQILEDGTIEGTFSNGQSRVLGQVGLALFKDVTDLQSVGHNMLAASSATGEPLIGGAATGGRGEIFSGALEQSNVDLTNEFTHLIVSQRGFQASSRTVTTADQMLTEAINLKR